MKTLGLLTSACAGLLLMTGCSTVATSAKVDGAEVSHEATPPAIVIKQVNVVTMTEANSVLRNANVVIDGTTITAINGPIPAGAKVIDGQGKWLMPGLIDMHVHNLVEGSVGNNYPTKGASIYFDNQDVMLLYVATGVTTAFELSGRVEHFGQRNQIVKGEVIGPRIALAALIDGRNSNRTASTPEQGRQAVRTAKGDGYEFIKVYSRLNQDTYHAIIDEAQKQDLKVVGHLPGAFKGETEQAFVPHFGLVAHAEEFSKQTDDYSAASAQHFAEMTKANGTWVIPNLSNLERITAQAKSLDAVRDLPSLPYVHPLMQDKWLTANQYHEGTSPKRVAYFESLVDFHVKLVKAFKAAGVPMLAGTDAGTSGIVWGYALHDELALLVDAGLTTEEALAAATRDAAKWLEIEDKIGTVEEGKFADLILLNSNPLDDITNTQDIAGVFFNGRWVDRATIDSMLAELAKKNAANIGKDAFLWSKIGER